MTEREYRTGFLNAAFGAVDYDDAAARRIARRENVLAFQAPLYHYTSLAGFKGIVETDGFWASDNRFLNDAEEVLHGARLAGRVLEHRIARAASPEMSAILEQVRNRILEKPQVGQFVACFSTSRDSLEQWRGYTGAGGVCLKLSGPKEGQRPFVFAPDQMPHQVLYRTRPKAVLLLSKVQRFEQEYALDKLAMQEYWPDDHDENYVERLHMAIAMSLVVFKDHAFEQEAEVRIVLGYRDIANYGGVEFRPSSFGLIPFLNTGRRAGIEGPLPIGEIIVGPSAHQELVFESVKTFMSIKGYPDVPVEVSKVPYRHS
ncbi:hypothetical protein EHI44_11420 [Rhizobium leguminosarum]|uniref:hypothetical protein n=1 Tax=Rhizobium leguminosarum TaxID=384 RepID=UPI000FEFC2B9|nr:hypothetical protein [Rhizobium leguminosarum]RWY88652.1 hypothetical protein EHI44_11420 [Rhizobium leguminosarum]